MAAVETKTVAAGQDNDLSPRKGWGGCFHGGQNSGLGAAQWPRCPGESRLESNLRLKLTMKPGREFGCRMAAGGAEVATRFRDSLRGHALAGQVLGACESVPFGACKGNKWFP